MVSNSDSAWLCVRVCVSATFKKVDFQSLALRSPHPEKILEHRCPNVLWKQSQLADSAPGHGGVSILLSTGGLTLCVPNIGNDPSIGDHSAFPSSPLSSTPFQMVHMPLPWHIRS